MSQELEGTLTNSAELVGSFGSTGSGSNNYNDLVNKPSINNVELSGNKTGNQLGLVSDSDLATVATTGNYNDLVNKPSINNVELSGNKTGNQLGLVSDSDLATVATTGNYNDLLYKPTIPAAQVNSDWNAISGVARILNKPTIPTKTSDLTNDSGFITDSGLATVATTGDYDDLTNKPTIPTNNDFNLSGLGDVSISGATQGQVLTKGASSWGASSLTSNTAVGNFNFYKYGKVVYCSMITGSVTTDSTGAAFIGGTQYIIPDDYKPVVNCEAFVTNLKHRCIFQSDKQIIFPEDVSGTSNIRVSACWITS